MFDIESVCTLFEYFTSKIQNQNQHYNRTVNMSFSSLTMAAISPTQFFGVKSSLAKITTRDLPLFQVRCKGNSEVEAPKQISVTRRDAMICVSTLSLAVIGVSSTPKVVEARVSKEEMRRKIKEKLEKIREKAGLSKDKEGKKKSSSPSSKKENTLLLEPPFPLPSAPQGLEKSLVETSL